MTHTTDTCQFEKDVKEEEYQCVSNKKSDKYPIGYVLTLQVKGELSPGRVQWGCVHPLGYNKSLNIAVENHDTTSRKPTEPKTSSTHYDKTPTPTQSPRPANNVCTQQNNSNTILTAICVVGVLVLINIIFHVMSLYDKRKQDYAKQGSSKPLALEPRGPESNYAGLDNIMDDGHTYDTAQAAGVP
ncbi:hypothetical protein LOTGIDRAFT_169345 [Lottia gigantea]|uniref:Uncharacterized protein n=1 Tax=Lottia gigantea TaxID=225164 RepID=V3YYU1_LOTGI|nr:hypothetical protein LOTGIDRAFT_169345 [Lottia gigantea]ESO83323.1 hypothetical protein LOTGIDRAFT_169345 [Lottia gigantea]